MQKKCKITAVLLLFSESVKKKDIMILSKKLKKYNLSLLTSVKTHSFSAKPSVKMQKKYKITTVLLLSSESVKKKDVIMLSKKFKKHVFSPLTSVKIYFFGIKIKPALYQSSKDIKLSLSKIHVKRQARDSTKNISAKHRALDLQ